MLLARGNVNPSLSYYRLAALHTLVLSDYCNIRVKIHHSKRKATERAYEELPRSRSLALRAIQSLIDSQARNAGVKK
jgi:hypothetical protein